MISISEFGLKACKLLKRGPNTDVSREFCEIFKNTFLKEHLQTTASTNQDKDHKENLHITFSRNGLQNRKSVTVFLFAGNVRKSIHEHI